MKSTTKTTSKLVSSKPLPSMFSGQVAVGGGAMNIVGPGSTPPLKDYKKEGAT